MAHKRGERAGIQSIEVGAPLLVALTDAAGPMTLTALADAAEMTPSKAHKYLASFVRVGLVSQSAETGRYSLGPLAVEIGFSALRRLDVVQFAQDALNELRDRLGFAGSLTIWGNHGPTIVRKADNDQPVSLVVQLGMVLPVLTSSNGRIFAAYLDRSETGNFIKTELAVPSGPAARAGLHSVADVEKLLAAVRKSGIAVAKDLLYPGVAALSAPVFDHRNALIAAITVVGVQNRMDLSLHGEPAKVLRESAKALSRRLGAGTAEPVASAAKAAKAEKV
jgi:DNA-binding IclR family transcriptional regulator